MWNAFPHLFLSVLAVHCRRGKFCVWWGVSDQGEGHAEGGLGGLKGAIIQHTQWELCDSGHSGAVGRGGAPAVPCHNVFGQTEEACILHPSVWVDEGGQNGSWYLTGSDLIWFPLSSIAVLFLMFGASFIPCVFVLNEAHNQNTAPLPWNHLTRSRSTDTKPHPEAVLLSWRDSGSCCLWDWPAERFGFLLLLLYLETSSRGYFCWNVICSSRRLIRVRKVRSDVCRIPRHAVCPPIEAKWLIVHRFGFSHLVAHVINIYWSWRCLYHKTWRLNWLN